MDMITQTEQEPSTAERARDYLAGAEPVDRMPPSRLMLDLRLARTFIELLLRETGVATAPVPGASNSRHPQNTAAQGGG